MNETVAWIIYALFALGGAGLYLALPRTGRSTRAAGAIIGLSAVAALLALMAGTWAVPGTHNGYFLLFAGVAIVGSARVVTHRNPVYSAVYFVLVVVAVAMIMVLQMAEFLAIAIIIIYAGAILVTYVFVIMLAQQHGDTACDRRAREPFGAVLVAFVLTAAVTGRVAELPTGQVPGHPIHPILVSDSGLPVEQAAVGNVTAIGQALLTRYVVALEIAGVLLLVAMVGAIALAKKEIPPDESAVKQRPLGEAGREVEPF
ncbi:MAG: NADH-quinone oxidoreductase subunit J [Planctomycetes bacterium]|nr:NADH-quinone oxidoreductase subunit J [Planctomycetota bacterium]